MNLLECVFSDDKLAMVSSKICHQSVMIQLVHHKMNKPRGCQLFGPIMQLNGAFGKKKKVGNEAVRIQR